MAVKWSGKRLKEIRKERGMSQVEFAELLGISEKGLRLWEKETHKPHAGEWILEGLRSIDNKITGDDLEDFADVILWADMLLNLVEAQNGGQEIIDDVRKRVNRAKKVVQEKL